MKYIPCLPSFLPNSRSNPKSEPNPYLISMIPILIPSMILILIPSMILILILILILIPSMNLIPPPEIPSPFLPLTTNAKFSSSKLIQT